MAIEARAAERGAAWKTALAIVAVGGVALLAIDAQGYWMDELGTWRDATAPGLASWVRNFLAIDNSDGQLPVYHFLVFLWSRLFGTGEVAIRSLNAVFLLALVLPVLGSRAVAGRTRGVWIALLLANAFVWSYLNEARPYVLLMAGATYLTLALAWAHRARATPAAVDAAFVWLMIGAAVSFGASPVAAPVVLAAAGGVVALAGGRMVPELARAGLRHVPLVLGCVVLALLVAALVLYSMGKGATPELANKTSIATVVFGAIEVLGGGGLAPDRAALRSAGMGAIAPWRWALLAAFATGVAGVALQGLRGACGRLVAVVIAVAALSILGVSIAGTIIGFRVVGRHIAFACPMLMFAMAIGVSEARALARRVLLGRAAAALLIAGMLASTAMFRLDARYGKDQTNEAAALMRAVHDKGGMGWWYGAPFLAERHAVVTIPLRDAMAGRRTGGRPGGATLYAAPDEDWRALGARLPAPQAILVERPENADADGFFAGVAARNGLRAHHLRGYDVYTAR